MNRLLIGCAALALLGAGSAAYAQDANQSASGIGSPAATAGKTMTPPANSNNMPAPSDPAANAKTDAASDAASPATPQASGTPAPAIVDGSAQATTPPPSAGATAQSATATPPAPPSTAMASNGAVVGDLATTNPPPSAYPPCTKKGQDRCTVKSQMRTASVKRHTTTKAGA